MTTTVSRASFVSRSESETNQVGRTLASQFEPGDVVALRGAIGAGKTTLIRGICQAYGIAHTSSPTFIIMNEHEGTMNGIPIIVRHFDFYRVHREKDLAELGIDDFLNDPYGISLIEWSEHVTTHLPDSHWTIHIEVDANGDRCFDVERH